MNGNTGDKYISTSFYYLMAKRRNVELYFMIHPSQLLNVTDALFDSNYKVTKIMSWVYNARLVNDIELCKLDDNVDSYCISVAPSNYDYVLPKEFI